MAAEEENGRIMKALATNGGDGNYSYANNSSFQRRVIESTQSIIAEVITEKLDNMTMLSKTTIFRIADFGCSTGPNTFFAMQTILEAVEQNTLSKKSQILEFQVFFNDRASNDFNSLFTSLPKDRTYFASGIPGSFYGRLFPASSLHFAYSSCAINWLSRVPKDVVDESNKSCWNKGKIHYSNADDKVAMAYANQHAVDMDKFFQARAQEMVVGALMVIICPARPNNVEHSDFSVNVIYEALGYCFSDMVEKKVIDEKKLDSFNVPAYFPSAQELEESINRNGCFSLEKNVSLPRRSKPLDRKVRSRMISMNLRAILEGLIKDHFGKEIIDELFEMFTKKLEGEYHHIAGKASNLFLVLMRK